VVGDVRQYTLRDAAAPEVFAPRTQQPWLIASTRDLVLRAAGGTDPAEAARAAAAVIRALDPEVPITAIRPMEEIAAASLTRPRFQSAALMVFAAAALLLACFGIYGAVAMTVTERTREFGIRLAVGASGRNVLWRAARYGAVPAAAGLIAGIPLAIGAGRIVRQQLYGVGPSDVATLSIVSASLGLVALIAAVVPACRAMRIDPATTLRHEAT
jgi:ABC-type lipoprotein release transport system permease subunit